MVVARYLIPRAKGLDASTKDLNKSINELERLYYGLNFTRQITPRMKDVISSFGERLSAQLLSVVLRNHGAKAAYRMPHDIGIITDGKYGDATADLRLREKKLRGNLEPLLKKNLILFIPGFYEVGPEGDITTFGRGGSDYSAAVVAAVLKSENLEIWKDVDGFMSADPRLVPDARLIPVLSYEETSELAYFGAKILHPRSVEPIRVTGLKISIKNTLKPNEEGSLITMRSPRTKRIVQSVSHDTDIGILKVHASGVGARPGILAQVAGGLVEEGINIKSVVTSQTCISLLLSEHDLESGSHALMEIRTRPFRRLEILRDVALISIVGDGILHGKGIAARRFSAVADCNINVEMISFGPSRAALYFLTKSKDLKTAVHAIHTTFFSPPE